MLIGAILARKPLKCKSLNRAFLRKGSGLQAENAKIVTLSAALAGFLGSIVSVPVVPEKSPYQVEKPICETANSTRA